MAEWKRGVFFIGVIWFHSRYSASARGCYVVRDFSRHDVRPAARVQFQDGLSLKLHARLHSRVVPTKVADYSTRSRTHRRAAVTLSVTVTRSHVASTLTAIPPAFTVQLLALMSSQNSTR